MQKSAKRLVADRSMGLSGDADDDAEAGIRAGHINELRLRCGLLIFQDGVIERFF